MIRQLGPLSLPPTLGGFERMISRFSLHAVTGPLTGRSAAAGGELRARGMLAAVSVT